MCSPSAWDRRAALSTRRCTTRGASSARSLRRRGSETTGKTEHRKARPTMADHKHDPALERLLGPAAYEGTGDGCFEQLDEYVELELAGIDADARIPGLRAHLEGCPACNEEHDSLRALLVQDEHGGQAG